jgi:hypothetical protein
LLEALGLALHETGFHRKTRLRQIECVFIIHARQRAGRYQSRAGVSIEGAERLMAGMFLI